MRALRCIAAVALVLAVAAAAFVYSGVYDVSATDRPAADDRSDQ